MYEQDTQPGVWCPLYPINMQQYTLYQTIEDIYYHTINFLYRQKYTCRRLDIYPTLRLLRNNYALQSDLQRKFPDLNLNNPENEVAIQFSAPDKYYVMTDDYESYDRWAHLCTVADQTNIPSAIHGLIKLEIASKGKNLFATPAVYKISHLLILNRECLEPHFYAQSNSTPKLYNLYRLKTPKFFTSEIQFLEEKHGLTPVPAPLPENTQVFKNTSLHS